MQAWLKWHDYQEWYKGIWKVEDDTFAFDEPIIIGWTSGQAVYIRPKHQSTYECIPLKFISLEQWDYLY